MSGVVPVEPSTTSVGVANSLTGFMAIIPQWSVRWSMEVNCSDHRMGRMEVSDNDLITFIEVLKQNGAKNIILKRKN